MAEEYQDNGATESYAPLTEGAMVSQYKILKKIGSGGMGEVFLAEDTKLNRTVALKFLPSHLAADSDARARFMREAHAAAKLNHPNIVTIHDVSEYKGRPFIAMEHVAGTPLREVIKKGRLSVDDVIGLASQMCEGLQEAHQAGIVHRDIKPGNIIIDEKNRLRLLDFGLATVKGTDKLTRTGSTLGTVGYMAPEQVSGKQADHRSDLFSAGVVIYELISGKKPFTGDTDAAVLHAITHESQEPLSRFKSGVSGELQRIVDKALAKEPSLRYQSAADMLVDLRRLKADYQPRKGGAKAVITAVAVALIVIAGGYFIYSTFLSGKATKAGEPKRIVVLPFDNLGSEEKAYFAEGVTDEIMSRLSSISGLAVISRLSAAWLKESKKTIGEIGKELNAEYVLDGTIRWQENAGGESRIRLMTQLIRVSDDVNLWSKAYDTVMTEIFSVQADIAEKVSKQLGVVLLDSEKEEIWERWTTSEQAYDLYLRGREYAWKQGGFGEKPLRLGLEMFLKAIELDSSFALAYNQASQMYSRLYHFGLEKNDSTRSLAKETAEKALKFSKGPWAGNHALGEYYYRCLKDYDKALKHYDLAFKGNRNHTNYLNVSHHVLRRMGRWDEAIENMNRVIELQPKSTIHRFDLAQDYLYIRNYARAEVLFDSVISLMPDFFDAYEQKVRLYLNWQGDTRKAREVIRQSYGKVDSSLWATTLNWLDYMEGKYRKALEGTTIPPYDRPGYYSNLGLIYYQMGKRDSMLVYYDSLASYLENFLEDNPDNSAARSTLGKAYAALGRKGEAIREGQKAMELNPISRDAITGSAPLARMMEIYLTAGDMDLAMNQLEEILSVPGSFGIGHVLADPDYTPFLDHPRFPELLGKYGDSALVEKYRNRQTSL